MITSIHHKESTESIKGFTEIISFYKILDIAAHNSFIISNYNSLDNLTFMKNRGNISVTLQLSHEHSSPLAVC